MASDNKPGATQGACATKKWFFLFAEQLNCVCVNQCVKYKHSIVDWIKAHTSLTGTKTLTSINISAQCAFCKVRCHCIFYGPGIRYSGIFCVPCISSGYSDIFWHISVVDTVAYFGGNHGSRVWKSLKLKKVYFPRTWTSWDKYMFNRIVFFKF